MKYCALHILVLIVLLFEFILSGFPLEKEKINVKKARKLLSNVELIDMNRYEGILNLFLPYGIEFRYEGDLDQDGNFAGYGILEIAHKKVIKNLIMIFDVM